MTGSAGDGPEWQKHIGNKKQRRDLANQFKDARNTFKIVIVRDMWLSGLDAPCLHTMYADKPMQVIEELIQLAKDLDAATKRGEDMGLTDDEVAFYDALAANDSAVQAMGDAKLKVIAAELISQVKKSVTIDWTLRESARAKIKVMVKRILNKHGYPPDLQEEAVKTVLAQAELLCAEWV